MLSRARNLISLLLSRDPDKRPSAARVLQHPFVSGKNAVRMDDQEASFDVFLSYRVNSDAHHAESLYYALLDRGLKVWWDKKCLTPGQNWEEAFCTGLVKSSYFVCLLSF
jgi:serine/threonine protein kinase